MVTPTSTELRIIGRIKEMSKKKLAAICLILSIGSFVFFPVYFRAWVMPSIYEYEGQGTFTAEEIKDMNLRDWQYDIVSTNDDQTITIEYDFTRSKDFGDKWGLTGEEDDSAGNGIGKGLALAASLMPGGALLGLAIKQIQDDHNSQK